MFYISKFTNSNDDIWYTGIDTIRREWYGWSHTLEDMFKSKPNPLDTKDGFQLGPQAEYLAHIEQSNPGYAGSVVLTADSLEAAKNSHPEYFI